MSPGAPWGSLALCETAQTMTAGCHAGPWWSPPAAAASVVNPDPLISAGKASLIMISPGNRAHLNSKRLSV